MDGQVIFLRFKEVFVRQGCPLSSYLFILAAEVLATAIRKNNNIKEISVNNVEIKLKSVCR